MGLDAIVWTKKGHGSVDQDVDDPSHVAHDGFHLGNIALVGHVRDIAEKELPEESILRSKILYSGIHCGDEVGANLMPALRAEIGVLARANDDHVRVFCDQLTELAIVAEEQVTAISFV